MSESLDRHFTGCNERIIVTTFASNVHRHPGRFEHRPPSYGRKVAVTGRSMENILKVATELDYLHLPENTLVDLNHDQIDSRRTSSSSSRPARRARICPPCTAWPSPATVRWRSSRATASSSPPRPFPGNEKSISRIINELYRKGAEVIYDKLEGLHVSGHACQEELKIIHALTKPKFFIPVHGEQRHLQKHAALARRWA